MGERMQGDLTTEAAECIICCYAINERLQRQSKSDNGSDKTTAQRLVALSSRDYRQPHYIPSPRKPASNLSCNDCDPRLTYPRLSHLQWSWICSTQAHAQRLQCKVLSKVCSTSPCLANSLLLSFAGFPCGLLCPCIGLVFLFVWLPADKSGLQR